MKIAINPKQFIKEHSYLFINVLDSMEDMCFLMMVDNQGDDIDFRYIFANTKALEVTNLDKSIYGKRLEEVLPQERASYLKVYYRQAIETGQPAVFEEWIEDLEFFGENVLTPIKDENGQNTYILAVVRNVTERKKSKAELEKRAEIIEAFVEGTADAIIITDTATKIVQVNRSFVRMFGYSEDESIGKSSIELGIVPEEYLGEHSNIINELLDGTSRTSYDTERLNKYGQKIDVSLTCSPIKSNENEIVYLSWSFREITDRKQAEKALKESSERYKSLFLHHPDAVFSLDTQGNFISANPAVERITGFKLKDMLNRSFIPLIAPEFVSKALIHFYKAVQGEPVYYELEILNTKNERVNISIQNIPILVDGKVTGVYGIARDRTEEIEAHQELLKAKEQLEMFWNHSITPIFLGDTRGNIQKVNPAFTKLFGYTELEITSKDPSFTITPPNMLFDEERINERIRRGESVHNHETKRRTKDGKILNILSSYTPVHNKERKIVGFVAVYNDISELKRREEELTESESMYRLIVENSSNLIALLDNDCTITYLSPSYEFVLGFQQSQHTGKRFIDIVDDESSEIVKESFDKLFKSKKGQKFETIRTHRHIEGESIYFENHLIPICSRDSSKDNCEQIDNIIVISRDVTDQKRVELALRESDENFRLIAHYSSDLITILDPNGVHLYTSQSHEAIYGYDPSYYIFRSFFFDVHPEDLPLLHKEFIELFFTKDLRHIEMRKTAKGGEWIWIDAVLNPVLDDDGNIKHIVTVARNMTERKQFQEQLEFLAYRDSLTNLPNRRLFNERLEHAIKRHKREKKTLAVMVLDCDKFKNINDNYGHDVGDMVIQEFAKRISSSIRETDTVSRMGGDEFEILLPDITRDETEMIAERIIEAVRKPLKISEEMVINISTSIGISLYPLDTIHKDVILKNADIALYAAKDAGRDNYQFYTPEMKEELD
ncbi:PAS domain S-box protein [Niallia taxi]|uniref:PAS domain S-box protein n=1 Tax=Niallia taxi TaxID=2499688 RepID=UPI0015F4F23F|nr:PAS domain S-box protein [Niallia taxi]